MSYFLESLKGCKYTFILLVLLYNVIAFVIIKVKELNWIRIVLYKLCEDNNVYLLGIGLPLGTLHGGVTGSAVYSVVV